MKSNYTKPFLGVEIFSIFQSAARDCADSIPKEQVTFNDISTCAWDLGGGTIIFIVGGSTCTDDGEEMGIACYNNPGEGSYIFRS